MIYNIPDEGFRASGAASESRMVRCSHLSVQMLGSSTELNSAADLCACVKRHDLVLVDSILRDRYRLFHTKTSQHHKYVTRKLAGSGDVGVTFSLGTDDDV